MEIHANQAWQIATNDRFTAALLYVTQIEIVRTLEGYRAQDWLRDH